MWAREYRGDLGIALSDVYGMDAFLRDFDMYFCKLFDGARHDSGDPLAWGERFIAHYQRNRVDPRTKTLVFSDSLTIPKVIELYLRFRDRARTAFGVGTNLTNDVGLHAAADRDQNGPVQRATGREAVRLARQKPVRRSGLFGVSAPGVQYLARDFPLASMPRLSRRADSLGTENAFVVLAEVNRLMREGRDIVSFCIGQPDFPTPSHIQDAAIDAVRSGKHGYTPSAGIDELRAAAAKSMGALRGLDIAADEVVVGAGAKPFIAYTIASVTDYGAGDEVIYPVPGFPIYESQIVANGAVPVSLPLSESRGFAFDPAALAARIGPKTRLLILNTPHNPTGGIAGSCAIWKRLRPCYECIRRFGSSPTRSTASSSMTASSAQSRRYQECANGQSFPTARRRPMQ